jgi:hypothetical protein
MSAVGDVGLDVGWSWGYDPKPPFSNLDGSIGGSGTGDKVRYEPVGVEAVEP